jgi:tyrosyl-tRNA synthetase
MLTREDIEKNFQTYKEQASKLVDFSQVKVVHNSDWLKKLGFADVLRLTSIFSVNDFISRELIRRRLDEGNRVSLSEVLYPIMQGYDSYHLDTDIQLGGTDQIFNMQAGRTMVKHFLNKESFVLANGFLLGTDGRKMSKSWGNAIWLDDSPADIFGKVMSLKDELIMNYFLLATDLTDAQVSEIEQQSKSTHPMELKKMLGRQIVRELYGEEAIAGAEAHFSDAVQKKVAPENTPELEVPSQILSLDSLFTSLMELGLTSSKSEARRLFEQGALYLDEQPISVDSHEINLVQAEHILRVGKRKYLKIISKN